MDMIAAYYKRVAEQINKALEDKGITQKHLAKECKTRFGIEIAQSTISKILHSEGGHMSAVFVCAICQALEISLPGLPSIQSAESGGDSESAAFLPVGGKGAPEARKTLISNPLDDAFFGYIGRTYDIFFWSTNSSENRLIRGTMTLSNEDDKRCRVDISLDTGKLPVKEYHGHMVISLQQHACYCTVENQRIGERCSFVFYHWFFSQGSLQARLASVCTVSTGDARRPLMHRMAICEQGSVDSKEKEDFVAAQLLLNNAQIIIPEEKMARLRQDEDMLRLLSQLDKQAKPFYVFEENEIRTLPDYEFNQLANAIAKLRISSASQHYNKIGGKADDFLYKYLFKYTAQENLEDE